MEENHQSKKEYTKSLVSNLKDKISEFKNRKAHEKMERKNELDFEINKDLVNQFKKNKNTNLVPNNEETKISNNTPLKEKPQTKEVKSIQQEYTSNQITKQQQETVQSNQNKGPSKEANALHIDNNEANNKVNADSKKQDIMTTLMNKMINLNSNSNSNANSSTKGNNYNSAHNNNNNNNDEGGYSMPIKKDLLKGIPKYSNNSNYNNNDNAINAISSKNKIRNFIEQLDEPRRIMSSKESNNKSIPLPTYSGPSKIKHSNTNSINRLDKKKDSYSLEAFGDFNYKSHNNSSIINNINTLTANIEKTKGFSPKANNIITANIKSNSNQIVEPVYRSSFPIKTECPIKASDIRSIANKIRFLSGEDAKCLDKNVIDELANLKEVINRLFDSKLKYKY